MSVVYHPSCACYAHQLVRLLPPGEVDSELVESAHEYLCRTMSPGRLRDEVWGFGIINPQSYLTWLKLLAALADN